ncbi:MAG: NUDIX domain-containing protein [Ignavibacteria bacterium]|nr:NUDIX domain-containing protein [Ignavibacteria bacterium]
MKKLVKKPKRISAGILMYRVRNGNVEVLLAHPGGPYFANKDDGYWSVPKGEPDGSEELLSAAIREFTEETGIEPNGEFLELGSITQKGGKEVFCWAVRGDYPENYVHKCNMIDIEWPPRSGKFVKFPEIDRVEFFSLPDAKTKIKQTQIPLLERLEKLIYR